MKTLHTAYRVSDLDRALGFYLALGFERVGRVALDDGASLTMLKLPGDEFVALELVHRPGDGAVEVGTGFSHLVVQVADLARAIEDLTAAGLEPGPGQSFGEDDGSGTAWLTDPDGYRIELVQWPSGHPAGMTAADFTP